MATNLKALLRRQHCQTYECFKVEYLKAAREVDPTARPGCEPSRAQFHRWLAGGVSLPHARHCRVLEAMLPGWTAQQLFEPESADGVAAVPLRENGTTDDHEDARAVDEILGHLEPASGTVPGMTARLERLRVRLLDARQGRERQASPSLVLVAGFAGSGKSEFSRLLSRVTGWPVLDKDTMTRSLVESFLISLGSDANDRHTPTYIEKVRPLEYHCLMSTAVEQVEAGVSAIVSAPFLAEVGDDLYLQRLVNRCVAAGADLTVVWVQCDPESMHEYLLRRGAARDAWKLANWDQYLAMLNLDLRPSCDHYVVDNRLNGAMSLLDHARGVAAHAS